MGEFGLHRSCKITIQCVIQKRAKKHTLSTTRMNRYSLFHNSSLPTMTPEKTFNQATA